MGIFDISINSLEYEFQPKISLNSKDKKGEKFRKGTACGVALLDFESRRRALIRWRKSALEQPQQPLVSTARRALAASPRAELWSVRRSIQQRACAGRTPCDQAFGRCLRGSSARSLVERARVQVEFAWRNPSAHGEA